MFTHVGRSRSTNRRQRAGSLVLSLMLVSSAATALVFSGNQYVEDAGAVAVLDLIYPDEARPHAMPAPPPPKGVEDGGATEETPPEETPPEETPPEETPEDLPDEPEALDDPPDDGAAADEGARTDAPKGLETGSDNGIDGGIDGGTGDKLGGDCVGPDCEQVITMHYSQLQFRTKVVPLFPRAAKKLGLTAEDCQVRVDVDVRGRPSNIEVLSCPAVFHDELIRAASKWRFIPAKSGGYPVRATTVIPVHFRLN